MIAVDTNILVYAHRRDMPFHDRASTLVNDLALSGRPWALPWPCIHEFYGIVTNSRIFKQPSTSEVARLQIGNWLKAPQLVLLCEGNGYWDVLESLLRDGRVTGPRVHDARIAAICLQHAVRELWTADRDFSRFSALVSRNPLSSEAN